MTIFPVLDVLNGVVVRGLGGRRSEYRPVESCLATNAEVQTVARAFRDQLGLAQLYVADLDAILDRRPNLAVFRELAADGFHLLVDAGLRADASFAEDLLACGVEAVIAGLETSPGPRELRKLAETVDPGRVIFSLDLKAGRPMTHAEEWRQFSPLQMAEVADRAGIRRLLVLDVAAVGQGCGPNTVELCRQLRQRFPATELIAGGGIRDATDLLPLADLGLAGVLVASALHNGRIGPAEVARFRQNR